MITRWVAHLLFVILRAFPVFADTVETFEGPDPTWTLAESDCQAQAVVHQRRLQDAHTGQGCEFLRIQHGQGSSIYLTHRIDPSPVIEEWAPSLWIKSDQPGVQLLARVVLPRTLDPRSGKPLTTFLFGGSYTQASVWQQLVIAKPVLGLERQVRALRSQWGPKIDTRQAYVDLLVLNAYTGGNSTQVWIDDLEVRGHVEVRVAATSPPFATRSPGASIDSNVDPTAPPRRFPGETSSRVRHASFESPAIDPPLASPPEADVRLQGSVLTTANRPLLARIARWRGEPFDWLQDLGFNTLLLAAPPTAEQLAESRRLGLWLIIPPPWPHADAASANASPPPVDLRLAAASAVPAVSMKGTGEPADDDRVLAWNVGSDHLDPLAAVAERAAIARQFPADQRRPLFGAAAGSLHAWSRTVDILATPLWSSARVGASPSSRVSEVSVEGPRSILADIHPGVPVWAEVALPRLPEVLPVPSTRKSSEPRGKKTGDASTSAFSSAYAERDLIQIRWRIYQAISDGARGFVFSAPDSLEPGRGELRPLLSTVRTLNAELALLEPWVAASHGIDAAVSSEPGYQVRVLHNDRGRLAVVLRDAQPEDARRKSSPSAGSFQRASLQQELSFVDPGAASGVEAYEVTPGGLRLLRRQRVAGGVQVSLEHLPAFALVVLTQEPIVVNYLARRLATGRGSPAFR